MIRKNNVEQGAVDEMDIVAKEEHEVSQFSVITTNVMDM